MFLWLRKSFSRQVISALIVVMLFVLFLIMSISYINEKEKLQGILESQISQLNHTFSLSISNKVFYNKYFELSDDLLSLYNYNNESASKFGALYKIEKIAILDKKLNVLAHSAPIDYPIGIKYEHDINESHDKSKSDIKILWNDKKNIFYIKKSVYHSKDIIGYIIMDINPILFKKSNDELIKHILIIFSLFILILVIFSIFFAKWINKPFLEIMDNLTHIGEGDISFTHSLKRKDEFKLLATAIKEADKRIYEQKEELLSIQKGLEQTVEDRTKELIDKANSLSQSIQNLKNAQKQLIETEKMSALGSLVAGVAHEINTPLGISITGITFIEDETKRVIDFMSTNSLSKSALEKYLNTVQTASHSMFLSLNNAAKLVRSFKQVAIDQHTEDKRDFNLSQYVDEVLTSLHNKIKTEPITVNTDMDESINLYTYAGIFSQAVTNFIMNSLAHAFDDKEKQYNILIRFYKEDEYLYFTYEDDGQGIDEKNIEKIFNPFFTTKLGQGGSGLGLNIIHNLVNHKLKGDISAHRKDPGLKIIIKIPFNELTR